MARLASAAVAALLVSVFALATAPRASALPNDAAAKAFCRRNFWTVAPEVVSTTTQTVYTTWTYTAYLPMPGMTSETPLATTEIPSTTEQTASLSTVEPSITPLSTAEPTTLYPCTATVSYNYTTVIVSLIESPVTTFVTETSFSSVTVAVTSFITQIETQQVNFTTTMEIPTTVTVTSTLFVLPKTTSAAKETSSGTAPASATIAASTEEPAISTANRRPDRPTSSFAGPGASLTASRTTQTLVAPANF
ncbi:hypothetical protein DFJ74DRAFT_775072 [Hyaloraphidium curvatum]|nr:hypothetical protein DFJ74DRAFT_775072 [Hyaloraphidium curvatum]